MLGYAKKMCFFVSSCTDSLQVLPRSTSETFSTSSDCTYDVGNVKDEVDLDMQGEEEEVNVQTVVEECIDIKQEDGTYCEEEEDIDTNENVDVDLKEEGCTDPLHVLPGSSSEMFPASSGSICDVSNTAVEEDVVVIEEGFIAINKESDIGVKQEEIPKDISFPDIKVEPDESCTDSLFVLPGSSSETFPASSYVTCDVSSTAVEEDIVVIEEGFIAINKVSDISIKQEEIAEDISFPGIKAQPNEGTLNETSSEEGAVEQRQEIHALERTCRCEMCNRTFSMKSNLKSHQHVHTGERPCSCEVSNRTFSIKSNLKVHLQVHTG